MRQENTFDLRGENGYILLHVEDLREDGKC